MKNTDKTQNHAQKWKIEYNRSQKYVKYDFIARFSTSGFKKRWVFYEFGGVGNVMELFGFIKPKA